MKGQHFFKVGLAVLLLALLVAYSQVSIAKPETDQPAPVEVVAPQTEEQSLTIETEATTGSAFSAANPELMVADRYPAAVAGETMAESALFAANPELLKAHPPIIAEEIPVSTFLAANPELMVARRHAMVKDQVDPDEDIGLLEFFTP